MNVIVDTSSWILYFASSEKAEEIDSALADGRVYIPPLVVAELLSGKMVEDKRKQLKDFIQELPLCMVDKNHWFRVGDLRSHLFSQGISISTPDAHIVQCTLDLRASLISEDTIFRKIKIPNFRLL